MKKQLLSALLLCFTWIAANSQEINAKKLDSFINYIELNNKDIGSISIAKGNKEVYSRHFGQQSLKGIAIESPSIKYHIGSITKMLTAIMIFQLVDRNKLELDEKLITYFPEAPNADKIDIGNLLEHSSGLADFLLKQDSLPKWLIKPVKQREIMDEIKRQGVLFQPGDSVRYSNTGYYLLARILEKKYKRPYKEILLENIIAPLQLNNTHSVSHNDSNVADSYRFTSRWERIEDLYFPNVIGVGDVVSTPKELNIIINALFNDKLVSKESLEKMKPLSKHRFGRGVMQIPFYEILLNGHGGDTFGTHSLAMHNVKDGLSVSAIINGQVYSSNNFLIGILSILYNKDLSFPNFTVYTIDPLTLNQYESIYSADNFPLKIKIVSDGKDLKAQATGQNAFTLEPFTKHQFRKPAFKISMEFKPDESKMIFKQGDHEFVLVKE